MNRDERVSEEAPDAPEREAAQLLPHHRGLALGATLTIVGLGFVGTRASEVGAIVVLAGLLLLFYRIHRYGRLGRAGD